MKGNSKSVANCEIHKCDACEFVKVHHQSNKVNTIKKNHMKEQELNKDHPLLGQMVSVYHYILKTLGRIYHTKVKSDPSDIF